MPIRDLDDPALRHLMVYVQDGVVSRRQLLAHGATPADLERWVRRRTLSPVHRGVFIDHTGPPSAAQRAWAAVLVHAPAALTGRWALPTRPTSGPVHVAINARRSVRPVPGVVAHRMHHLPDRLDPRSAPPRVRLEHAVLDLASQALAERDLARAFGVLAELCGTRRTSPEAIREALGHRDRVAGRPVLLALLDDIASGCCSVLERAYVREVERPHGLPAAVRQDPGPRTAARRRTYRDARYAAYGVVVELDGRAHHGTRTAWDADHARDLEAAARDGDLTLRLTYTQVVDTPCRTADRIGRVLAGRGWPGVVRRCPRCLGNGLGPAPRA